ncbi:MAG: methyltransferase domain-containing protein [Alkalicoccus sp.]|nr:MAG: methyltransferase domain-containing protein [Alkalicoccus sp.]
MQSKKEKRTALMQELSPIFRCPKCGEELWVDEGARLMCIQGHSFDLARQGHVHLTKKPAASNYSSELFAARREVIEGGLYEKLHEALGALLNGEGETVLDAGSGEGSHLAALKKKKDFDGIGADLAKAGIEMAAKGEDELLWVVADLAEAPFLDSSFETVLNIFSPANYEEFQRITKNGGTVLKVVPESRYLQELRELAGEAAYSNEEVVEGFYRQFPDAESSKVSFTTAVPEHLRLSLLKMTPLTWKHSEDKDFQNKARHMKEITIDVLILKGKVQKQHRFQSGAEPS